MLEPMQQAYTVVEDAMRRMNETCRAASVGFLAVFFPQRFQVQPGDWKIAVAHYGLRPEAFDIAQPNEQLERFFKANEIAWLDLTPGLSQAAYKQPLYMPLGDMHWNRAGHREVARLIAEDVWKRFLAPPEPGTAATPAPAHP